MRRKRKGLQMFYVDREHELKDDELKRIADICRKKGITKAFFYYTALVNEIRRYDDRTADNTEGSDAELENQPSHAVASDGK